MKSGLRTFIVVLSILACVYLLPAVAQASEIVKLKVAFMPNRLGASTTFGIDTSITNSNGGPPSPVTSFNLRLPANLELIGSTLGLAICHPIALLTSGLEGCSPNARLGSGHAIVAVPFGPETLDESANIEALMGPPAGEQIGVLLFVESQSPVFAQLVFPGVLLIGSENIEHLNTAIPVTPTLPGAPDAAMTYLHLEVGPAHLTYYRRVHGRMVGYRPSGVSIPPVCPRGGFPFVAEFTFQDGTSLAATDTVSCPPSRHGRHH